MPSSRSRTDEPRRPLVVLLTARAGSARQWSALAERLAARFDVRVLDFHGNGARAPWAGFRPLSLVDEAALVAPILGEAPRVHLVGYSYGAAVALKIATMWPARIASVAVYEPAPLRSPIAIRGRGQGEHPAAAHFDALRREAPSAASLRRLPMPVLVLSAAAPAAGTAQSAVRLRAALPSARHVAVPGAGQPGAIAHAGPVGDAIVRFLARVEAGAADVAATFAAAA